MTDNGKLTYRTKQSDSTDSMAQLEPHQAITTLFVEQPKRAFIPFFAGSAASTDGSLMGTAGALLEQVKVIVGKRLRRDHRDISGFQQFLVLLRVMLLRTMRSRLALIIQFVHHIMCGLFFGLIFFQLGNQGARMFDHLKFCIGAVLMIVYTQVMVPILSCKCCTGCSRERVTQYLLL